MVIGPGKNGIAAFVILGDGELIPERLNTTRTLIFRQGKSTDRMLQVVKALGDIAPPELVYRADAIEKEACPGLTVENDPVHEHGPGEWYFYERTWTLEQGPYSNETGCRIAHEFFQKTEKEVLTIEEDIARLSRDIEKDPEAQ